MKVQCLNGLDAFSVAIRLFFFFFFIYSWVFVIYIYYFLLKTKCSHKYDMKYLLNLCLPSVIGCSICQKKQYSKIFFTCQLTIKNSLIWSVNGPSITANWEVQFMCWMLTRIFVNGIGPIIKYRTKKIKNRWQFFIINANNE